MTGAVSLDDPLALTALAEQLVIVVSGPSVQVDGVEVSGEIRTPEIDRGASRVARVPGVRAAMVAQQRRLGAGGGVVMEGRDIGTVVFPDAAVKIYLDASAEERARVMLGAVSTMYSVANKYDAFGCLALGFETAYPHLQLRLYDYDKERNLLAPASVACRSVTAPSGWPGNTRRCTRECWASPSSSAVATAAQRQARQAAPDQERPLLSARWASGYGT